MSAAREGLEAARGPDCSEAEWAARVDLAAAYRLLALYGLDDRIATHVSNRVPDEDGTYLLNPLGLYFDEITASSLIKVDYAGRPLSDSPHPVNRAGVVIHSAVLEARPDVRCVVHTHTQAGMAISALEDGLLPITQTAMHFYGRTGMHDYEGVAFDDDEKARLARDLGPHCALILRNHGLLTAGASVSHAVDLMVDLDKACRTQLDALATGRPLVIPSEAVCRRAAQQYDDFSRSDLRDVGWPGHLRRLDRLDPSYRS